MCASQLCVYINTANIAAAILLLKQCMLDISCIKAFFCAAALGENLTTLVSKSNVLFTVFCLLLVTH